MKNKKEFMEHAQDIEMLVRRYKNIKNNFYTNDFLSNNLEHHQQFVKIHLANTIIWQLPKIYDKLKNRLSPIVCHFNLVK